MSHTKSTALERLVIQLLGGLNRFYRIPTLAPGLHVVLEIMSDYNNSNAILDT